jgi:hypothetical protein
MPRIARPDRPPARYRVEARHVPFTPSWFWEIIDTRRRIFLANSLALSRTLYPSPSDALTAGQRYLDSSLDLPRAA